MNTSVAEVGLVHGSGFEVIDGEYRMSAGTRYNAERAAQLLSDKSLGKVLCSGRGPVRDQEYPASEAQLMADFLVEEGFAGSQIEVEDLSTSAIGNWARSAPILRELDATSVMGVTAKVNISRMRRIGDFVASRSDFELVGYTPSAQRARVGELGRELIVRNLTRRFLAANTETPIDCLEGAYEAYKSRFGLVALKRYLHRGTAAH